MKAEWNRIGPVAPGTVLALDKAAFKGPVFDPTHPDFGADPLGVIDSTAAIQAAITAAAAAAGGGTVEVPAGTYKMTRATGVLASMGGGVLGASLVLASKVMLRMAPGAVLVQASANTDMLYGNGLTDVVLDRVAIQGLGGADNANAAELVGITRLRIKDCKVDGIGEVGGAGGGGFIINGCSQVIATGCRGVDCGYAFFNVFNTTSFVVAHNTHINTRGATPGPVTCVYVDAGSADGAVIGNIATANNYSFQARSNVQRVAFIGNIARGELAVGITAQSLSGLLVTDISVIGNEVQLAAGALAGIDFDGVQFCSCSGNTVSGPGTQAGIRVTTTSVVTPLGVAVTGNTVRALGANGYGILVASGSDHTVTGNIVNCPATGQRSIAVTGAAKAIVADNIVIAANFHAIDCSGNDSIVKGNLIDGTTNGGDGINVSGTGCLVLDNMCRGAIAGTPFNVTGAGSYKRNNSITNGARSGQAVLVAGTVTVNTIEVRAADSIILTRVVAGGALGHLSVGAIVSGTSFVINSSSGTDTSTIFWEIAR